MSGQSILRTTDLTDIKKKIRKEKGMNEYEIDRRFIENLKKGMKQTSGIALGVDRLLMVLLCKNSINDVILFPEGSF
ncbi:MAG: amino acid--tRNA ligase-related protein [Spirochaetota bacterium]